jgi:hypothetical protein
MSTATTTLHGYDGTTYGVDERGQVMWATYSEPPKEAKPGLPVEVYRVTEFDPERAWRATELACRGQ